MLGTDIPHADIIAHDDEDVWLFAGGRPRRQLLRLRGAREARAQQRRGCHQRRAAQQQVAPFEAVDVLRDASSDASGFLSLFMTRSLSVYFLRCS
jgi:hypothetical protein